MPKIYLPSNLKVVREKWNMTQEIFAVEMGETRGKITAYETGVNEPKLNFLVTLFFKTGISITDFLIRDLKSMNIPENPLQENPTMPLILAEPETDYEVEDLMDYRRLVAKVQELDRLLQELKERIEREDI